MDWGRPDTSDCYVDVYDELGGGDDDYYDDDGSEDNEGTDWRAQLEPLLTSLKKTPLKRLALTNFDSADSLVEALAASGLPETIEFLDLSQSSMSDSELKALLAIDGVNGLTQLDLRETQISPVEVEKLRAQGPEMLHSEGGLNVRYVVGME